MLLVIAHIQLHKQIAKAIYNWNANEGCAAMWLLLHCETHQVASAAGMVDGSPTNTHTHTYYTYKHKGKKTLNLPHLEDIPSSYFCLFADKLTKTVENNAFL